MNMQIPASSAASASEKVSAETSKPIEKVPEATSPQSEARTQLNTAIIQASIEVSINSQNEPLALLFRSAITGINELLKPEFGENAIQNAVNQDNTPEGTAGRIVAMSTGFYENFKQQHLGEDEAVVLKLFMETLRTGFEQGYNEASDILKGMQVLSGDIASNIEKTHELVLQGYAEFEAAQEDRDSPSADE